MFKKKDTRNHLITQSVYTVSIGLSLKERQPWFISSVEAGKVVDTLHNIGRARKPIHNSSSRKKSKIMNVCYTALNNEGNNR